MQMVSTQCMKSCLLSAKSHRHRRGLLRGCGGNSPRMYLTGLREESKPTRAWGLPGVRGQRPRGHVVDTPEQNRFWRRSNMLGRRLSSAGVKRLLIGPTYSPMQEHPFSRKSRVGISHLAGGNGQISLRKGRNRTKGLYIPSISHTILTQTTIAIPST